MESEQTKEGGRILGLDYGSRRIGVSISDPLRILATSYGVLENSVHLWEQIGDIIRKENVVLVVVGMPLNLKGQKGQKAEEVDHFVRMLKSRCGAEVVVWDERFTTSMAKNSLVSMGASKKQRRNARGRIDAMAAAIMLQSFLDRTKHSMSC